MKQPAKKTAKPRRKPSISPNELRHLRAHLLDLTCRTFGYRATPEKVVEVAAAFEKYVRG